MKKRSYAIRVKTIILSLALLTGLQPKCGFYLSDRANNNESNYPHSYNNLPQSTLEMQIKNDSISYENLINKARHNKSGKKKRDYSGAILAKMNESVFVPDFDSDIVTGARIMKSLDELLKSKNVYNYIDQNSTIQVSSIVNNDYYIKNNKKSIYTTPFSNALLTLVELLHPKNKYKPHDSKLPKALQDIIILSFENMYMDNVFGHPFSHMFFPLYMLDEISRNKNRIKQKYINNILCLDSLNECSEFATMINALKAVYPLQEAIDDVDYCNTDRIKFPVKSIALRVKYQKRAAMFINTIKENLISYQSHPLQYWAFLERVLANCDYYKNYTDLTMAIVRVQKNEKMRRNEIWEAKEKRNKFDSYITNVGFGADLIDVPGLDATRYATHSGSRKDLNKVIKYMIEYAHKNYDISFVPVSCVIATYMSKWDLQNKRAHSGNAGFMQITKRAKKYLKKYQSDKWNEKRLSSISENPYVAAQAGIDFLYIIETELVTLQKINSDIKDVSGVVDINEIGLLLLQYTGTNKLYQGFVKKLNLPTMIKGTKNDIGEMVHYIAGKKIKNRRIKNFVKTGIRLEELFSTMNFSHYSTDYNLGIVNCFAGMIFSNNEDVVSVCPGIVSNVQNGSITCVTGLGNNIIYSGDTFIPNPRIEVGMRVGYNSKLGVSHRICISAQIPYRKSTKNTFHHVFKESYSLVPVYEFSRTLMSTLPEIAENIYAKSGKRYKIATSYVIKPNIVKKHFSLNDVTYTCSGFGMRRHPVDGRYKFHAGIDVKILDDKIVSVATGVVEWVGWDADGAGNYINMNHNDCFRINYSHLKYRPRFSIGDTIKIDDRIGTQGKTGRVTGKHLHFAIEENINYGSDRNIFPIWVNVNPKKWVDISDGDDYYTSNAFGK